ncbi:MAG: DUF1330 domain-containing protein [Rhodospirillaceae bacterium]|jgi:uncharacterized protein (DUF1330 family)
MTAYLIANVSVNDPDGFAAYREKVSPLIEQYGGRYIVRGGEIEHVEGEMDVARLVIVEFEDMDALRKFYFSDDYKPIKAMRFASADSTAMLVEGYAG